MNNKADNNDIGFQLEQSLKEYFEKELQNNFRIPTVKYFEDKLNL